LVNYQDYTEMHGQQNIKNYAHFISYVNYANKVTSLFIPPYVFFFLVSTKRM